MACILAVLVKVENEVSIARDGEDDVEASAGDFDCEELMWTGATDRLLDICEVRCLRYLSVKREPFIYPCMSTG